MSWERVKELFHATVHLPPAEREARLGEVDADVRREVELTRSYLGIRGRTVHYLIAAVPPAR